jgi:hypothetical protein
MEENKNTQLDAFLKKQIQDIPLESPSTKFTSNIMDVIQQEESAVVIKYKPLISKKIWFAVAAAVAAIFFFIPLQKKEGGLLEKVSFDFSFLDQVNVSGLFSGLSVSTTAFYGLLFFAIMILIQVVYLKGYFAKRIDMGL